ncbi:hypothetical protein KKB06_03745, partial [Patescibacteria group bacterium]|nr:hypothetical protein [Patescibacteria group bacterium]
GWGCNTQAKVHFGEESCYVTGTCQKAENGCPDHTFATPEGYCVTKVAKELVGIFGEENRGGECWFQNKPCLEINGQSLIGYSKNDDGKVEIWDGAWKSLLDDEGEVNDEIDELVEVSGGNLAQEYFEKMAGETKDAYDAYQDRIVETEEAVAIAKDLIDEHLRQGMNFYDALDMVMIELNSKIDQEKVSYKDVEWQLVFKLYGDKVYGQLLKALQDGENQDNVDGVVDNISKIVGENYAKKLIDEIQPYVVKALGDFRSANEIADDIYDVFGGNLLNLEIGGLDEYIAGQTDSVEEAETVKGILSDRWNDHLNLGDFYVTASDDQIRQICLKTNRDIGILDAQSCFNNSAENVRVELIATLPEGLRNQKVEERRIRVSLFEQADELLGSLLGTSRISTSRLPENMRDVYERQLIAVDNQLGSGGGYFDYYEKQFEIKVNTEKGLALLGASNEDRYSDCVNKHGSFACKHYWKESIEEIGGFRSDLDYVVKEYLSDFDDVELQSIIDTLIQSQLEAVEVVEDVEEDLSDVDQKLLDYAKKLGDELNTTVEDGLNLLLTPDSEYLPEVSREELDVDKLIEVAQRLDGNLSVSSDEDQVWRNLQPTLEVFGADEWVKAKLDSGEMSYEEVEEMVKVDGFWRPFMATSRFIWKYNLLWSKDNSKALFQVYQGDTYDQGRTLMLTDLYSEEEKQRSLVEYENSDSFNACKERSGQTNWSSEQCQQQEMYGLVQAEQDLRAWRVLDDSNWEWTINQVMRGGVSYVGMNDYLNEEHLSAIDKARRVAIDIYGKFAGDEHFELPEKTGIAEQRWLWDSELDVREEEWDYPEYYQENISRVISLNPGINTQEAREIMVEAGSKAMRLVDKAIADQLNSNAVSQLVTELGQSGWIRQAAIEGRLDLDQLIEDLENLEKDHNKIFLGIDLGVKDTYKAEAVKIVIDGVLESMSDNDQVIWEQNYRERFGLEKGEELAYLDQQIEAYANSYDDFSLMMFGVEDTAVSGLLTGSIDYKVVEDRLENISGVEKTALWLNQHTQGSLLRGEMVREEGREKWRDGDYLGGVVDWTVGATMQTGKVVGEVLMIAMPIARVARLGSLVNAGVGVTWKQIGFTIGGEALGMKFTGDSLAQTAEACGGANANLEDC